MNTVESWDRVSVTIASLILRWSGEGGRVLIRDGGDGGDQVGVLAPGEASVLQGERAVLVLDCFHPDATPGNEQCREQPGEDQHGEGEHPALGGVVVDIE